MEKGNEEAGATAGTGTTTASTGGGGGPSEIADQRQESSAEWVDDEGRRIRKTVGPDGTTTTEVLDELGLTTESRVVKPRPDGKLDVTTFDGDGNQLTHGTTWDYDSAQGPEGGSWRARKPDGPNPSSG